MDRKERNEPRAGTRGKQLCQKASHTALLMPRIHWRPHDVLLCHRRRDPALVWFLEDINDTVRREQFTTYWAHISGEAKTNTLLGTPVQLHVHVNT